MPVLFWEVPYYDFCIIIYPKSLILIIQTPTLMAKPGASEPPRRCSKAATMATAYLNPKKHMSLGPLVRISVYFVLIKDRRIEGLG